MTIEERVARLESRADDYRDRVVRIEGHMEAMSASSAKAHGELHSRITRVEVRVAYYAGWAAALGGLVGTLVGVAAQRLF